MKNKIIKILFLSILLSATTYAASINIKVDKVTDNWQNSISVNFDKDLTGTQVSWDVKIFRDLEIGEVTKDENLPSKLNLKLDKEVKIWNTYNIFAVFWVDWTADFMVENGYTVKMISKAPTTQWIVRVAFKDATTMELYFKDTLTASDYEFKLLEEYGINDMSISNWDLVINSSSTLESDSAYILMIISLDDDVNEYVLDESIFDFTLWKISQTENKQDITEEIKDILTSTGSELTNQEIPEIQEEIQKQTWTLENQSGALNWNVEEIAKTSKETPDTWAETWVLMLLTLIISTIYFLARKTA